MVSTLSFKALLMDVILDVQSCTSSVEAHDRICNLAFDSRGLTFPSIPLLRTLIQCQSLGISNSSYFRNLNQKLYDYFNDPIHVMPQLRYFKIVFRDVADRTMRTFEYDEEQQIWKDSKVKMPATYRRLLAPASRLVGIELNPGPSSSLDAQSLFADGIHTIMSLLSDHDWRQSSQTCKYWSTCAASSPNRRIKYETEYETTTTPNPSLERLRSGCSSPLRHHIHSIATLSFAPIDFELLLNVIRKMSHLETLHINLLVFESAQAVERITSSASNQSYPAFPFISRLRHFSVEFNNPKSSVNLINPEQVRVTYSYLIPFLSERCTLLEELTLENLPCSVDCTPIQQLEHLSTLSLSFYGARVRFDEQPESQADCLKQMRIFSDMNQKSSFRHLRLSSFAYWVTLIHLLSRESVIFPRLHSFILCEANLTSYNMRVLMDLIRFGRVPQGALSVLHQVAPSLRTLLPASFALEDMCHLSQFEQLEFVRMARQPSQVVAGTDLEATPEAKAVQHATYISTLLQCHSLTSIQFAFWSITTAQDWSRLFSSCPSLTHLQFHGLFDVADHESLLLDLTQKESGNRTNVAPRIRSLKFGGTDLKDASFNCLVYFTSCECLHFYGSTFDKLRANDIFSYFKSHLVMPTLKEFDLDYATGRIFRWRVDQKRPNQFSYQHGDEGAEFRLSSTNAAAESAVPQSRLVGIELNPGPLQNHCDATSVFTDGLHLIFSFLSAKDWISALHSCHTWYRTCGSGPLRQVNLIERTDSSRETIPFMKRLSAAAGASLLRRHLSGIYFVNRSPRWCNIPSDVVQSIINLVTHFSSLTCLTLSCIQLETDLTPLQRASSLIQLTLVSYQESLLNALAADSKDTTNMRNFQHIPPQKLDQILLERCEQLRAQIRSLQIIPNLRRLFFKRYSIGEMYERRYNQRNQLLMQILNQDANIESKRICFPHITEITNYRKETPADFDALTNIFPGLHVIQLTNGCLHEAHLLARCTHLQSLKLIFYTSTIDTPGPVVTHSVHPLIQISHSLEQLSFDRLTFTSLDEWQRLFSSSTHLTSLTFKETSYDALLEHLTSPLILAQHQLISLTLIGTQLHASSFPLLRHLTSCRQLYLIESPTECKNNAFQGVSMLHAFATFNDSSFMPSLTTLTLSIYPDFSNNLLTENQHIIMEDLTARPARTFMWNREKGINTERFRLSKKEGREKLKDRSHL